MSGFTVESNLNLWALAGEGGRAIKKAINLLSHDHHENWFAFYDRGEAPFNHIRSWVDRLVKKGNEAAVGASILCNSHLDGATKVPHYGDGGREAGGWLRSSLGLCT